MTLARGLCGHGSRSGSESEANEMLTRKMENWPARRMARAAPRRTRRFRPPTSCGDAHSARANTIGGKDDDSARAAAEEVRQAQLVCIGAVDGARRPLTDRFASPQARDRRRQPVEPSRIERPVDQEAKWIRVGSGPVSRGLVGPPTDLTFLTYWILISPREHERASGCPPVPCRRGPGNPETRLRLPPSAATPSVQP